jgi:hypothetical protein
MGSEQGYNGNIWLIFNSLHRSSFLAGTMPNWSRKFLPDAHSRQSLHPHNRSASRAYASRFHSGRIARKAHENEEAFDPSKGFTARQSALLSDSGGSLTDLFRNSIFFDGGTSRLFGWASQKNWPPTKERL